MWFGVFGKVYSVTRFPYLFLSQRCVADKKYANIYVHINYTIVPRSELDTHKKVHMLLYHPRQFSLSLSFNCLIRILQTPCCDSCGRRLPMITNALQRAPTAAVVRGMNQSERTLKCFDSRAPTTSNTLKWWSTSLSHRVTVDARSRCPRTYAWLDIE